MGIIISVGEVHDESHRQAPANLSVEILAVDTSFGRSRKKNDGLPPKGQLDHVPDLSGETVANDAEIVQESPSNCSLSHRTLDETEDAKEKKRADRDKVHPKFPVQQSATGDTRTHRRQKILIPEEEDVQRATSRAFKVDHDDC